MRIMATLSISLLLCVGCVTVNQMPKAAVSEYIKTEGAGFALKKSGENTQLFYGMTYKIRKALPDNVVAKVEFDNPEPGSAPLITETSVAVGSKEILIQSPLLSGIINNHNYTVVLYLYQGDKLITTHSDQVRFQMQSTMLQAMNIRTY